MALVLSIATVIIASIINVIISVLIHRKYNFDQIESIIKHSRPGQRQLYTAYSELFGGQKFRQMKARIKIIQLIVLGVAIVIVVVLSRTF